jgi:hypothetical protein
MSAHETANTIRRMRGLAQAVPGSAVHYADYATGQELAPPTDAAEMQAYLSIALEILALSQAGADPVHDLDALLAVSLLKSVLGQM